MAKKTTPKQSTTLRKALEYFYSVCRQRNLSENTVHFYQQRLDIVVYPIVKTEKRGV